ICAAVASALLLPSAIGFGGSAARLSLVRRARDLAAMRLVGGTPGQVGGSAGLDVAAPSLLGALGGTARDLAAHPPLRPPGPCTTPTSASPPSPWGSSCCRGGRIRWSCWG